MLAVIVCISAPADGKLTSWAAYHRYGDAARLKSRGNDSLEMTIL